MNSLPNQGTIPLSQNPPASNVGGSGIGKEGELSPSGDFPIQEIHREVELPKEVRSVGVKSQPTVVAIPRPVQQMGVKPSGQNIQVGKGETVVLPLTQNQISEGLTKGIVDSWRWLAIWCIRRLKQLRFFQLKNQ
jgi:hypothetical protein